MLVIVEQRVFVAMPGKPTALTPDTLLDAMYAMECHRLRPRTLLGHRRDIAAITSAYPAAASLDVVIDDSIDVGCWRLETRMSSHPVEATDGN